jgi:hypothetical protein
MSSKKERHLQRNAKNELELCDAGLRLAKSIFSGFPLEVRFL